jgi:hypothetical protein
MFGDRLTEIGFLRVAAPDHPLASFDGMIPKAGKTYPARPYRQV